MAGALYMQSGGFPGGGGLPAPVMPWGKSPPATTPSTTAAQTPANQLNPQAVRASGPSQGYDPAYLQNLATAIGGLFTGGQQSGNTTNINPLGQLAEISPPSGIGGNAPTLGEPLTWLQQALNGGGFAGPSTATPASTTTPTAPTIAPVAPTVGGTTQPGGKPIRTL